MITSSTYTFNLYYFNMGFILTGSTATVEGIKLNVYFLQDEEKEYLNDVMKMSEIHTVGYVCCAFNNISSLIFSAVQRTDETADCANDMLISSSYFPQ